QHCGDGTGSSSLMLRGERDNRYWAACISAARTENVMNMSAICGNLTWYVPRGQGEAYRDAGAPNVREVIGGLVAARNLALREAWNADLTCLQLSDDAKKFEEIQDGTPKIMDFWEFANRMLRALNASGFALAGVAPTANAFFSDKTSKTGNFIVGDCIM